MIWSDQFRSFKADLRNMLNVLGTFVLRAEDLWKALNEALCTDLHENEAAEET